MSLPVDDKVRALLAEAGAMLERDLPREAADIFGRVLLLDRNHPVARQGLERAQSLMAEVQRRTEAGLEALSRDEGEGVPPRTPRPEWEPDALLQAEAPPEDRPRPLDAPPASSPRGAEEGARKRPAPLSRQALVAAWTVSFVTVAVGLAFSWDHLVERLVSNPAPTSAPIPKTTYEPEMTAGEIAVSRARELVARGDLKTALVILDEVSPQDAEYPFARRLRAQVLQTAPPAAPSAWK